LFLPIDLLACWFWWQSLAPFVSSRICFIFGRSETYSIEIEGTLPVDWTPTIKSVKGLLKIKKYSMSVFETTYLNLGSQASLRSRESNLNWKHTQQVKHILFRGAFSQGVTTERNNIITTRTPTHAPTSGAHYAYMDTLLMVQRYLSLYMQPNYYMP